MVRRFEYTNENSRLYWETGLDKSSGTIIIHDGVAGTTGEYKRTIPNSPGQTQKEYDNLITEKLREGYSERTSYCPDLDGIFSSYEFDPGIPEYLKAAFNKMGIIKIEDMFVPVKLAAVLGSCTVNTYFSCPTLPEFYIDYVAEFLGNILNDKYYSWFDFDIVSADNTLIPLRMAITEGDQEHYVNMWGAFWDRETGELVATLTSVSDRRPKTTVKAVSQAHTVRYKPHGRLIPDITAVTINGHNSILRTKIFPASDLEFEMVLILAVYLSVPYYMAGIKKDYIKYKKYYCHSSEPQDNFYNKSFEEQKQILKKEYRENSRYFENKEKNLSFEIFHGKVGSCVIIWTITGAIDSEKSEHAMTYPKESIIPYCIDQILTRKLAEGYVEKDKGDGHGDRDG
ncbi:MAG: WGR domain-containing protein [Spirochaetales bacterium]|nr:WGR domain-containing protein [Spirochaetales bacterium]